MLMNEEGRVKREEWSGSNKGTNVVRASRPCVGQGGETDQTRPVMQTGEGKDQKNRNGGREHHSIRACKINIPTYCISNHCQEGGSVLGRVPFFWRGLERWATDENFNFRVGRWVSYPHRFVFLRLEDGVCKKKAKKQGNVPILRDRKKQPGKKERNKMEEPEECPDT